MNYYNKITILPPHQKLGLIRGAGLSFHKNLVIIVVFFYFYQIRLFKQKINNANTIIPLKKGKK